MPVRSKWQSLPTEAINAFSLGIDKLAADDIVDLMLNEDRKMLEAVRRERERIAVGVEMIAAAFRKGGRIVFVGAGTSGRLGILESAEMPPTFGTEPENIQAVMAGGRDAIFAAKEGVEDHYEEGARAVSRLRVTKKDIVIGIADPRGAAMYNLFACGEAKASEGGSITEGIGLGRKTAIIENLSVDNPYVIPDEEALPLIFDLLEHEGLCMGGSTGINVAGAIRLAKDLGPGHTIVTILADYGTRYQSKLFNPEFLHSKKLPVPEWLTRKADIKPPFEKV